METDKQEPIAIVGLGCRFPGEAGNPNGFWELLSKGESAWSKVPRNRFDIDGYHHPSSDRGGAVSSQSLVLNGRVLINYQIITNSGFFLKQDPAKWDAAFFSMTPAEAAGTDPQQRILLEVAYEAFESGRVDPDCILRCADYLSLRSRHVCEGCRWIVDLLLYGRLQRRLVRNLSLFPGSELPISIASWGSFSSRLAHGSFLPE
jgi:hypothetical protein